MDKLSQLRKEWLLADKFRKIVIELEAKKIKASDTNIHKHNPSWSKSNIQGNYFIFICYCGEEMLRDFLRSFKH